jgi:hypothetical protein
MSEQAGDPGAEATAHRFLAQSQPDAPAIDSTQTYDPPELEPSVDGCPCPRADPL